MDFTLLIAMRVGRVARLFRTNSAQVVEQKGRWCIGIGKEFADYAFDLLLENRPSTELAAQVAAYVIGITKEHIEGVGHATDVHVLEGNGRHWSLLAPEVQEVESSYSEFFKTLRMVIECTDSRFTSEESIPRRLDLLGDGIKDLRLAQDKRMDLRARMQEVLQRHQLTKADQSPPPPLPESPGGSNES